MKYLMVCFGNICRSPMAMGIMKSKLASMGSKSEVDSCGFEPYHIGDAPDKRAQKVMLKNGIDISGNRARLFQSVDFDNFDHIFVMDRRNFNDVKRMAKTTELMQKVDFIMNSVYPGENMEVPDPYYGNADGFNETYAALDKAINAIINNYE
ncbi:MAG: protein-tyrosine-phosphatase [Bacteroidetes bacterium HGW-Bacteroidetes-6]|jgi:protein-tyrosine phosphatase|nr:MAG: protein-tyrosine-phosphatase [Bacteroidetes bacterium HGW-Bacteroidetes-6]